MRIYPNTVTTIDPLHNVSPTSNTYDHVVWLLKLQKKQTEVVRDMLRDIWTDDYWSPRDNKHTVLSIISEWTEKIDAKGGE